MMTPLVHTNGTSQAELLRQYIEAIEAMRAAGEALQKAAPNGRDYYLLAPGSYGQARREHDARCQRIADNIKELEEIAMDVDVA